MKIVRMLLKGMLITGLIFYASPVHSQSKFEISGGIGFPEMMDLKIKYGKEIKIALCQSVLPFNHKVPVGPTAIEIYYNFAGKSKFNEQPPWYLSGGFGYFWSQDGGIYDDKGSPYCFYPRIGRSFYFSRGTGINIDAGAFIPFFYFFNSKLTLSASINFFIKL